MVFLASVKIQAPTKASPHTSLHSASMTFLCWSVTRSLLSATADQFRNFRPRSRRQRAEPHGSGQKTQTQNGEIGGPWSLVSGATASTLSVIVRSSKKRLMTAVHTFLSPSTPSSVSKVDILHDSAPRQKENKNGEGAKGCEGAYRAPGMRGENEGPWYRGNRSTETWEWGQREPLVEGK